MTCGYPLDLSGYIVTVEGSHTVPSTEAGWTQRGAIPDADGVVVDEPGEFDQTMGEVYRLHKQLADLMLNRKKIASSTLQTMRSQGADNRVSSQTHGAGVSIVARSCVDDAVGSEYECVIAAVEELEGGIPDLGFAALGGGAVGEAGRG